MVGGFRDGVHSPDETPVEVRRPLAMEQAGLPFQTRMLPRGISAAMLSG